MLLPPPIPVRRKRDDARIVPTPPAVNVSLIDVLLLNSGALMLVFDGPVTVNPAAPPTTWTVNGFTFQGGAINYGQSSYMILNGFAFSGSPVIIAANDPGARTPSGGYVNAVTMVVSDL